MVRPKADVPKWLDLPRLMRTRPLPGWERLAPCRGAPRNLFYRPGSGPTKEVKAMCTACPTRYACLSDVLRLEEHRFRYGHFAATTPRERERIVQVIGSTRKRKNAAA